MPSHIAAESPVLAQVTGIFRDLLRDPGLDLSPQDTADSVPGWDSMTHIAVIVEAECRFGIQFHTAEIENLRSIGELVRSIQVKRSAAAA